MSSLPSDTPLDRGRPLVEHLGELRVRLVWSFAWVGGMVFPGWFLSQRLIEQMARVTGPMVYLAPTEAFAVRLKLSMILGLVLGAPFVIYHLWRFVGVALTISERRVVLGALPVSYLLFSAGSALGWFLIVPAGLRFLLGFSSTALRPTLSVEACVGFALWTSFGLGRAVSTPRGDRGPGPLGVRSLGDVGPFPSACVSSDFGRGRGSDTGAGHLFSVASGGSDVCAV
jgi:sec-independent protein translocase protein TatC